MGCNGENAHYKLHCAHYIEKIYYSSLSNGPIPDVVDVKTNSNSISSSHGPDVLNKKKKQVI